ncbi:hypothetical protein [Ilumatobacter sp.]|uniref:hypothetical protein n=1 Tax=Ilumatobacter sp. TaxID=1967498 RepID=UPI003299A53B
MLLGIVGIAAVAGGGGGDESDAEVSSEPDEPGTDEQEEASDVTAPDAAVEDEDAPGATEAPAEENDPEVVAEESVDEPPVEESPDLADGSRDRPFSFDSELALTWDSFGDADGSVWNTTVGTPRDITAEVLAENEFNSPPPDGIIYLGFDVAMTLISADKEPLSPGFNFSWEVNGGSSASVYDSTTIETESFGCGVVTDSFDDFSEALIGGTLAGSVCIPVPAADAADPGTQVVMSFIGSDRLSFGGGGLPNPAPAPVPSAGDSGVGDGGSDSGSIGLPFVFGSSHDVTFESFGDADQSVWNITVAAPRSIDDVVSAENQFNEPPPDGTVFAGFDVSMTLVSATTEPLSPGFNFSWEILGGASAGVYDSFTLATGCGVTPSAFGDFDEVLIGGTLTGTVCIPIPVDDLTDPGSKVALNFLDGTRIAFGS